MSDTVGFMIDVGSALIFGFGQPITVGFIDTPAFMVPSIDLFPGSQDFSQAAFTDSRGYLVPSVSILSGASDFIDPPGVRSTGFILDLITWPNLINDDGFLIGFNAFLIPSFPADPKMTEIIYPVKPISEANKVLFKLDSEEWRATSKASIARNEETDTIRFRVDTSYLATFLNDLHSNKANQFRLSTPGYTPFGSTSEDNYVRVLSHGRPQREDRGLTQIIDVEFLFMAVYP